VETALAQDQARPGAGVSWADWERVLTARCEVLEALIAYLAARQEWIPNYRNGASTNSISAAGTWRRRTT
jgi:hypothetical protein